MERRLAVILAADVAGYSRLVAADEEGTLAALTACRTIIRDLVTRHGGGVFGAAGDSLLAEFQSPVQAVRAAVEIQRELGRRNEGLAAERRMEFRIGINLGDVVVEGDDRLGEGVNVAARLQDQAAPGGICISGAVREQIEGKLGFPMVSLGEQPLKNIPRPVHVHRIDWSAEPAVAQGARRLPADKPSVAVLPFVNMSGDPEQDYFADGITEDLITDLSKLSGLHVIARNSVFALKDRPADVKEIGRYFQVRTVLEGSVRKAGQRVRITAQLVDARDGGHIWADRFDRDLTDIFAIQDEITRRIVDQLKVKLLPDERKAIETPTTGNVEAYTYYLRGRQFAHMCSKSYVLLARRMFGKAVELDPAFARAYAGMAICDAVLLAWHHHPTGDFDDILALSERALALEPNLAEAHASRGLALQVSGRRDEARADFERALAIDPNLYEANYFCARFFFEERNFERAAELFERAAAIRADDYRSPVLLASVYRSLGRDEDRRRTARLGVERAEREIHLHPENSGPAQLGALALAHLGERDRAREWAARTLAIDPDDILAQYNVACAYAQIGDIDAAIDQLEQVMPRRRDPEQMRWYASDSDLDPVRGHPRYERLLRSLAAMPASAA